jgi:predicted kinase
MHKQAFLVCGPSLAGKSTACARIASISGAAIISADAINAGRGLPFGGEGLPETVWAETLRLQLEQLHERAAAGRSVVVDDTLCYRWLRDRFRAEAASAGLQLMLLVLAPAREILLARHASLAANGDRPVLSLQRLLEHLNTFEWPTPDEAPVDVSTGAQLDGWLSSLCLSSRGASAKPAPSEAEGRDLSATICRDSSSLRSSE